MIGEKIVDALEGRLEAELRELWRWREEAVDGFETAEDGSRGGRRGMVLQDEVDKGMLGVG